LGNDVYPGAQALNGLFSIIVQFLAILTERLTTCASDAIVLRNFASGTTLGIVVVMVLFD
jgi:hypothetical protein